MELRHLRHFLAVAAELHMGRAAQSLGMAQPPLSQSIARLEKELGVPLFVRAHRRLSLTAAGMAFREEAQASVHHAECAAAFARSASLGEAGVIRIGFDSAALYQHLPQRLLALKAQYPAIHPDLKELSTNDQLEALAGGVIDIGFAHPPFSTRNALVVHDFPAEISMAVLFDDGATGDITLTEIAEQGLILFPARQGPVLHAQILEVFVTAGLEVRIAAEANRALTMLSLVSAKLGATILPASTKRLQFTGVRFAHICDAAMPKWPLSMVTRRDQTSRLVRKVWQLFVEAQCM
ncbi:LysR substrate-binding domain-containing protein [Burkholderia pyrrocinia]|uniref:LysR substrate-binding domain-containing protein n=1 Tax=Burkholderia pyrrocinia TaxID=60550 RepID=UPI00215B6E4E|nr:LysR substrate-binding domain-containing protein [Burkholderia pyrrocinia]UVE65514.1 LysR substrate-binding domain-containing protein [Burkholderia pyrrocinia]